MRENDRADPPHKKLSTQRGTDEAQTEAFKYIKYINKPAECHFSFVTALPASPDKIKSYLIASIPLLNS